MYIGMYIGKYGLVSNHDAFEKEEGKQDLRTLQF